MAKKTTNVAYGVQGMNRTGVGYQLDDKAYTIQINGNLETDEFGGISLTNEHSNLLCSRLKPGYKVIGSRFDINDSRVYLFLTNPDTGFSEIGYIPYLHNVDDTQDVNKECDCTYENILSTPLEEQVQIEGCEYVTLLSDDCPEADKCLGFSIYHPIKSIVISGEKVNKRMYWAVKGQDPRYVDLYNISQYKYKGTGTCGEVVCAEGIDVQNPETIEDCKTCIDCDKLKMFNITSIPNIKDISINFGGNLKMGKYEVLIAYCDRLGIETSMYYSKTGPISIFDKGNYVMEQPQIADRTNLAIAIEIEDLDISQYYYKVVVIAKADITGETTAFIEGIHPTTDTTVLISTEVGKQNITLQDIFVDNMTFKSFGGLATSNNYLFGYDYEVEKEWNLQPVVNLMGGFVKWQTHQAKSSLYEDGASSAKFTGFMRDEVYPLSIAFSTNYSYVTAKFPLIGRPPTEDELEEIVQQNPNGGVITSDINAQSILDFAPTCSKTNRIYKWQYHNTAKFIEYCASYNLDNFETILRTTNEVCKVRLCDDGNGNMTPCIGDTNCSGCTDVIDTIPAGTMRLPIDTSNFKGLKYWYRDNKQLVYKCCDISNGGNGKLCEGSGELPNGDCPIVPYPSELCTLALNKYSQYHCKPPLPFDICEECDDSELEANQCKTPVLAECSEEVPFPEDVYIKQVIDEKVVLVEKEWKGGVLSTEYVQTEPFGKPTMYIDSQGMSQSDGFFSGRLIDFTFANGCGGSGSDCPLVHVLKRLSDMMYNDSCAVASEIFEREYSNFNYFFDYQFQESCENLNHKFDRLITNHPSTPFSNTITTAPEGYGYLLAEKPNSIGFTDKISKRSLWFKLTKEELRFANEGEEPTVIIEATKAQTDFLADYPYKPEVFFERSVINDYYRVTILDSCNPDANIIFCEKVHKDDGWWRMIKESDFTNTGEMFIVFDSPIHAYGLLDLQGDNPRPYTCTEETSEFTAITPLNGTINIIKRYKEYKYAEITHGGIEISKKETYTTTCNYIVPYLNDCEPTPHARGDFSYWQSEEEYPNNAELYDSSKLIINRNDISRGHRDKFGEYYAVGETPEGDYILDEGETNFMCKPIRHYKFPDNKVMGASFIFDQPTGSGSETIIYPIGVTIDPGIVNSFLDIAVKNGLISQEQRDSISHYEIYRGDRTIHKSVLYKGIANDMYRYYNKGKETWFRNFPFNSLGENQLIFDSNSRGTYIQHPYANEGNTKFSLIAPEVYYGMPRTGDEVAIEGYQMGYSEGTFKELEGHSKWVILGDKAKDLASRLATLEVAFESAMNIGDSLIGMANSMWSGWTAFNWGFGFAIAGNVVVTVANIASSMVFTYAKKRYEWLEIFKNNGTPYNFAYRHVGTANYNFFLGNTEEDSVLRALSTASYIKAGNALVQDERGKKMLRVNNIERESSYFMSFGEKFPINYQTSYATWDNTDESSSNASRYISSDTGCSDGMDTRRVASPYMSVKVYNPAQYGTLDSVTWISTGKNVKIDRHDYSERTCEAIFGGDVFITKVAFKNKYRFFLSDAMQLANRTPFDYFISSNIGSSRFFASYETPIVRVSNGNPIPYSDTVYNFDCPQEDYTYSNDFYVKPERNRNSKFYLHYYGIPYFFVESTINNEYRYAGPELHEQFYPNIDPIDWTEEKNISIMHDNQFSYNNTYSYSGTQDGSRVLPSHYNKKEWDKLYDYPNGIVWSQQDNSEQDLRNPWLVFKPLDKYQFSSSYGKLIDVKGIESEQVLARFENNVVVFNAVDTLADRLTTSNYTLGTGGIFATRPMEFSTTDLGEMGTQSTELVSTEFGHFWVDAKRGKIFQLMPNAKGLFEVSAMNSEGKSTNMQKWFKRHLPFKILQNSNIEGLSEESPILDNKYFSLGINMWWDSKFKRLFVTKKDYKTDRKDISYDGEKLTSKITAGADNILKELEDVSWTVSYSPIYGDWISYYDFKPDFSISYHNFFQTGLNYSKDQDEVGIWSHLLTNKSFQVFYGKKYPWTIEVPLKNEFIPKILRSVHLATSTYRYHNDFDFAEVRNKGINKAVIYNATNNTGVLNIEYSNFADDYKYPIQKDRLNQIIKGTHTKGQIKFNYFFNRVINQENNIPIWLWDRNEIDKVLNTQAISFTSKGTLERLRGDMFFMRLTQDKSSQYKQVFKWGYGEEQRDTF